MKAGGITRRQVLIGGGAGVGLAVAWALWPRRYTPNLRVRPDETAFNGFLKIGRDGRVIVAVPQAEIGQGVYTSLPQILADELGADWRMVGVEPAPLHPFYANTLIAEDQADESAPDALRGVVHWASHEIATRNAVMMTGGSTSVRGFEARLREAGAAARALLMKAAAARWDTDWQGLEAHDGFVWRGRQRAGFGALAEAASGESLPDPLPMRSGTAHRLVGQSLPRLDSPAKLDGSAMFAADVRLPEMVYAALLNVRPGTQLQSADVDAANRVPDALAVFQNPQWVAAAGANWWAAEKALVALNARFVGPAHLPNDASISAALAGAMREEGRSAARVGDADALLAGGADLSARYAVGLAPSAPIEPLTATARIIGDRLEIWAPTQAAGLARAAAARAIGFGEDQVTVYPTLIGGGYGRKIEMDAIEQAAILATRLGRPVQLTWPRTQEAHHDRFRPPALATLEAKVARGGVIAAWRARIAAPATAAEVAQRIAVGYDLFSDEAAAADGALPPYAIGNVGIDLHIANIGLPTGLWRSGAHSYTAFFNESFIDEIARAAGMEPLSFRISMLGGNPRLARVLTAVTSLGGWDGGQSGSGMGLAAHAAYGSYIATLVEIEITGDQRIRVLRAVCAVDCGRAINPEIVKQQIEGGLIHGISSATGAPLSFVNGLPSANRLADYRLPILADSPDLTVEVIESDDSSGGVTELAVPTAAPAIANAVHALTGQRLRTLPLVLGSGR